jgi:CHAT domain-containing protein
VQTSLPPDAALVSFVRYNRTVFGGPAQNRARVGPAPSPSRNVSSYLAFVLRQGRPPAVLPLGPAQMIDVLVSQWRSDIAAGAGASAQSEAATRSQVSGAALRKLVWDPLTAKLADARRVFIVPDGTLSLVPFAALPIGQSSFLLERAPVIHYLSSERDVVTSARGEPRSGGLLAIGGPAFDNAIPTATKPHAIVRAAEQICGGLQGIRFQPLAGALQEVSEISRVWNAYATSTGGSASASVLVGRAASETAFKQEAGNYRVLHLATHGFFLTGDCTTTAAPAGTRAVGGLASISAPARPAENPLLLSGLALAGANRRRSAAPDADDGILTAQEVASLSLGGVEWAVLSACDTAVGEIKNGEGVLGLRRAFQIAGAHTVIMSLWSVDDQATRAWMRALYEARFAKQLSTDQAVHEASLTLLKDRRSRHLSTNPFYWAAFVAAGDWK